jgi:transcriptional antiterminator NusG
MENMGIVVDGAQAENADPVMEVLVDIEEGDIVTVVSGAWANREGIVKAVNTARSTVTIGIDVFGRETAVEISFLDIRKM